MLVAKLFSKIFKEGGIILIDHSGQKFICGEPRKEKPITVKLLKKNLNWNNWTFLFIMSIPARYSGSLFRQWDKKWLGRPKLNCTMDEIDTK